MPNRMFDPVSNPFAIQNLLEKKVETFVEQRDERAEAVFTFDAVAMANPVHVFSEQTIEDPAAADAQGFQAEWMDAENEFAGDAQAEAADFVAGENQAAADFSADGAEPTQAHSATTALADSEPAPVAAVAEEPVVASVADESSAVNDDEANEALAPAMLHENTAAQAADASEGSDATSEALALAEAVDVAEAPAAVSTADSAAVSAAPAEAAAQPSVEPAAVTVPVGLSDDELNARLEAAREEGRAEVREVVRAEAHQQGYDEGQAAGYAQAKDELGKEYENKIAQLQSMIDAMQALSYNPDAMFEPMKTLSVHLAEQLVRGELTQSPQAISRLVDNCLRELSASGEKAVIIHLHPDDVEQYKPQAAQFGDALVLRADPKLERGSVRASLEGSVVEDLIQRRVAGLKKGLMQAPAPSWRANAGRLSDRIADGQRGSQPVQDITITAARPAAEASVDASASAKLDTVSDSMTEAAATPADNADA